MLTAEAYLLHALTRRFCRRQVSPATVAQEIEHLAPPLQPALQRPLGAEGVESFGMLLLAADLLEPREEGRELLVSVDPGTRISSVPSKGMSCVANSQCACSLVSL